MLAIHLLLWGVPVVYTPVYNYARATVLIAFITGLLYTALATPLVEASNTYHVYPSMAPAEIQAILSNLADGDTVVFHPGIYESYPYTVSSVENVKLVGYGAVINATTKPYGFDIGNSGGGVRIEGFKIIGGWIAGLYIHNLGGLEAVDIDVESSSIGIYVTGLSDVRIENTSIVNAGKGVSISAAGDIVLDNISITNCSTGVEVSSASSIYIYNSTIANNTVGITVESAGLELVYSIVRENDIGVKAVNTGSLIMYFNRFEGNNVNAELKYVTSTAFTTGNPIDYIYNGRSYRGVIGNYWGISCSDTDGDGVGETPVFIGRDNGTGVDYYDTAPLCPVYEAEAYRVYFRSPGELAVETGAGLHYIGWRPNTTANFTAYGRAWYIFDHQVLGTLKLGWPAKAVIVNLTMVEVNGVRVASTAPLQRYSYSGERIELTFDHKCYVALAIPYNYISTILVNGIQENPRSIHIVKYNYKPWTLVEVGDPYNVTIILGPFPVPENTILPILLASAVSTITLLYSRRYLHKTR